MWRPLQDHDLEGEAEDALDICDLVARFCDSGVPRELIASQLSEFCTNDVASDPRHNFAACRLCFKEIVGSVCRKHDES
jgi:hypothetical protein